MERDFHGAAGCSQEGQVLSLALPTVWVDLGSPASLICLSFLPWTQHSFLPSCSWIEFIVSKFWCLLRQLWETDIEQLAKEAGIK